MTRSRIPMGSHQDHMCAAALAGVSLSGAGKFTPQEVTCTHRIRQPWVYRGM